MHHLSLALLKNRLHRFTLLTATVLVSLTAIPLTETNLGMVTASAQAQTTQNRKDEALRLYQVGEEQYKQSQFREALETFQQVLVIVRKIGERQGEGATLAYIGLVYNNLGEYPKALEFYTQALAIVKQIGNKVCHTCLRQEPYNYPPQFSLHPGFVLRQNLPSPWQGEGIKGWGQINVK